MAPPIGPNRSSMPAAAALQLHMLLITLVNPIFDQFSFRRSLRGLLGPFSHRWKISWDPSGWLFGAFRGLLRTSWGSLSAVCVLWVVFCDALGPRMRPRGPQEASGAAPQALQRPPGGIKKASPSSKSRFLQLCAEGVAGDAPQALSIRAPP